MSGIFLRSDLRSKDKKKDSEHPPKADGMTNKKGNSKILQVLLRQW